VDSLFDPSEDAGAGTAGRVAAAVQRSLDDLGTPLHQVTFCVIDLETTGGRRNEDSITEIGAVKIRGGERLGTFQTLVNPGRAIPPEITVLTGITQSMVTRAPRIETVLPSLLEFIGDAVIVGHNVGFDTGFLDAALARSGRPRLGTRPVDTLALARRLLADFPTSPAIEPSTTPSPPPTCSTTSSSGPGHSGCSGSTTSTSSPASDSTPRPTS
jgi:DNA polymerase III epsilon subunit-like protein